MCRSSLVPYKSGYRCCMGSKRRVLVLKPVFSTMQEAERLPPAHPSGAIRRVSNGDPRVFRIYEGRRSEQVRPVCLTEDGFFHQEVRARSQGVSHGYPFATVRGNGHVDRR